MSELTFSQLPLPPEQLKNLADLGYVKPTAVQISALPLALANRDLIAQAKTGSGKTAAFAIPLLCKLNPRDFGTQALVMCPTRELASQVATEIRRLARYQQNIKVVTLTGGQSIGPQIGSLEHGAHVVVGTPGRLKDHLRKKTLNLSRVSTVVLDEADRMLDMGFIDDIDSIVSETPDSRQTLLFSATYPDDIKQLSARFQRDPQRLSVESRHVEGQINQQFYICDRNQKLNALAVVLAHFMPDAVVVFCNTRQGVREVCRHLTEHGTAALALHGDLEQRDRDQVLVQFKHRSCRILVATDVAARGLDIDDLPMVLNYDLPRDPDVYVHRIGRTGRAGKEGLALTLFSDSERYKLADMGHSAGTEPAFEVIDTLPRGDQNLPPPQFATLCIAGGRKQKVRPGDILGALTGDAGIEGKAVGKIDVLDNASYVAIERAVVKKAMGRLINGKIKGRRFKVRAL